MVIRYSRSERRKRDQRLLRADYDVQDTLEQVVYEERNKVLCNFPIDGNSSPEEIFHWFCYTDRFLHVYEESQLIQNNNVDGDEMRSFKGRLFQDLCYLYYSNILSENVTLLSPERTLKLFSKMHPGIKKTRNEYGLNSLRNISVPDGLLVGELYGRPGVLSIFEYSCNPKINYAEKLQSFDMMNIPGMSQNKSLVFTVPAGNSLGQKIKYGDPVIAIEMPFTAKDFKLFFTCIDNAREMKFPISELRDMYLRVFLPDYEVAVEEPSIISKSA